MSERCSCGSSQSSKTVSATSKFIVRVGDHTREHYSFTGAHMLAERMHREIAEFDNWGQRVPSITRAAIQYRAEKTGRMLARRAVMASSIAAIAAIVGFLF